MKILIVEDHDLLRVFYRTFVQTLIPNATVVDVETAEEGSRLLTAESGFDIVITDFNTPSGTGFDVVEAATKIGVPKIIMITGQAEPDTLAAIEKESRKLGAHAFFSKPFRNQDLAKELKS